MPKIYKIYCANCGKYNKGRGKIYCSNKCAAQIEGKKKADKIRQSLRLRRKNGEIFSFKGYEHTEEWKREMSERLKKDNPSKRPEVIAKLSGSNSHLWRGGITEPNKLIRNGHKFRNWRIAVFERDNYTCQECGEKSKKGHKVYLEAHHIKSFSVYKELRFEVDNGRTLCKKCHKKTDNYGGKSRM